MKILRTSWKSFSDEDVRALFAAKNLKFYKNYGVSIRTMEKNGLRQFRDFADKGERGG